MSGILDRCTCTPNARVFMAEGQVYCTRCLSARSLLPLNLQVSDLGVLGLFYRPEEPLRWTLPRAFPTVECSPAGACWLSAIFPIARMTSGNLNFQQRMVRVAAEIYRVGQLTPTVLKNLQVYERGCRWYPMVGPVPGIAVFANSLHVSDKPFPGATHVLTNLPLPQRPKPEEFCPFECAMAAVYDIGHDAVMFVAEGRVSWAPRGGDKGRFEIIPEGLRLIAERLYSSFPPHHTVDMSEFAFTAPECGASMRVERQYGCLPAGTVPDGNCWWSLFSLLPLEVQYKEIRRANQFGYQTKHGVAGKYLQRRMQVNGIRAVVDASGPIVVQYFCVKESWIRHLRLVEEPSLPGFEDLIRIRVEPNTSPLVGEGEKIFRFCAHKWYGAGKRARKARSDVATTATRRVLPVRETQQAKKHEGVSANKAEQLEHYSPPTDGNCGWHCISAIINHVVNSKLETTLPERVRPSSDWATDEDLVNTIQILKLPVALDRNGACAGAKYALKLEGEHWTVSVTPSMSPSLLPLECVQGCCEHKGGLGSPSAVEVSGFDPACLDWLARVMHLPSSVIPAALAEMSGNFGRSTPSAPVVWTVSQFFTRHSGGEHSDQACLDKIVSLCQLLESCCCSQNKANPVTPEEVRSKIDQYLRGAASLEECLARLEKARPPSVLDTSFDWDVVLPGVGVAVQAANLSLINQCCAPVTVVTQKSLPEFQSRKAASVRSLPDDRPLPAPRRKIRSRSSEPVPVPAPRRTVPRLKPSSIVSTPVPAPRCGLQQVEGMNLAVETPACQDELFDLSASSQTEYEASPSALPQNEDALAVRGREAEEVLSEASDMPGDTRLAHASPSSSLSSIEITRPKYSAQAIIDTGGPCCGHLRDVKERYLNVMREACDATKLDDPATQEWLSRMWDRVDMLTWRNTSIFQAPFTLADKFKFLPKMILETPPPYPCGFVMMPRTPAPSVDAGSDITVGSVATEDVPHILGKVRGVCETTAHESLAPFTDGLADDQPDGEPLTQTPPASAGGAGLVLDSEESPELADLLPPNGTDAGGGGPLHTAKKKVERYFDRLSRRVFDIVSHLPVFFSRLFKSDGHYAPGDWGFAAFTLLCLFLCYSYPAFGIAPLLGVFSGSPRRVRMGVFGCWLAFAVGLFKPVPDPVGTACEFDSPECRDILHSFELLQPWDPVRSLVVGPVGLGLAVLGRLLGGARYVWLFLLRLGIVSDCILAGAYVLSQGRCKKCWGSCIRTAPSEVAFNVFPFTRATRSSLVDLCDRFCAPKGMDPIFLATGWRGCWAGQSPIEQPTEKPIAFAQLDEKKITAKTVVAQPYDPNQAVKSLRVLQAGGAMVAEAVPKVVKVSAIPFRAPFFPVGVKVDPECRVVVDSDTFTTALRSGYSTTNLILGVGDFAQLNGLKIRQISRPSGGGPHIMAALHVACSMALHMLVGIYVTTVGSCGSGTNDPWCANPFAVPVYGPGSLCTSRLCISQHGLTLPLTALVAGFGIQEVALVVLIFVSIGGIAHRLSCKADVLCILLAIASYVWLPLTWLLCAFPCWLRWFSLHPLTVAWLVFFLISVNMPSGVLALVLLISLWLLGHYTNVAGLVTPYDIHRYTNGPRGVAALATAPDGTYLAAVRRAALTGRTMLFTPSQLGSLLEGAFRTQKPTLNTVNVVGSSMGSGGVFTIDGKIKCVTAAHVLTGNSARVSGVGFNQMLDFDVKGDFAIADCPNWQGVAPKSRFCEDGWTGRAYWLTSSGVEPGVIGNGFAFCFTACGDSGSPVITEAGELVGVHTGSNKQGGGIVTRPSGQFCNVTPTKLSELSEFFAGPRVPLGDVKVGNHIIKDTNEVPSDLCALLAAKPELEGGLSTVQLLCVFFLLWRMMGHAWTPLVAVGFFVLNEILPAVLVRSVFSFGMFALSWFTPWSSQILMIRLLTAALNRNRWSLAFYSLGALTGFAADLAINPGHPLHVVMNLSTYAFLPRAMAMTSPVPTIACGVVHLLAIVLYLFKYRSLHTVLVGDGAFSAAFFLRYFAEGKLREGVSQSCGMNHESLTGALAMKLNDEDLDFLTKLTDFKCFVSASNMRNAAGQFIEAAYAKALRVELAQLVQVDRVRGVLAKLEAFADTVVPQLSPGDIVVALGHTPVGCIFDLKIGNTKHTLQAIETRVLAGSKMTVARVVDPTPVPPPTPVPIPLPPKVLENGPSAWGDDDRLNKKKRRKMEAVGIYTMGGKKYQKFWDKNSGDVFYEEVHDNTDAWECLRTDDPADLDPEKGTLCGHLTIENRLYHVYTSPSGRKFLVPANPESGNAQWEAARLSIEQALSMMNVDGELTAKEVEKLKRIIDKLQGLTKEQCLNC
uniref:Polyprotein 1a n=1 Tax=Porcine reproductive and respiratory syndrome virus TaxID=28344 RepID=A0A6B9I3H9_PRRSV|nr:polyprotein 1a [Porcine reproductive and respiratory syndrome virus]